MEGTEKWVLSVKYQPSLIPSGGLKIPLMLKFNCSKSITKDETSRQWTVGLWIHWESQDQRNEDEKEISTMFIDEDEDDADEKTDIKNGRCS